MLEKFQLAGLNAKLIATRAYQSLNLRRETSAVSAQTLTMPGSLHANASRGDQGVDALHYTERTGTASNDLPLSYSAWMRMNQPT